METIRLYPRIVLEEEVSTLEQVVTLEELSDVLKVLQKIRVPTQMGGQLNFSFTFLIWLGLTYLLWLRILDVEVKSVGPINSTFLALIPKSNRPLSFSDYRPIALCNLCYKIVTNIIAKRIRPILSRSLSEEQLGFLKGRQILDAIGTTQECLHSIKAKRLQAIILKLDLKKAYDCTNWDYLRLMLIQCGFGHHMTKWIMGCVTSASLAILINGEATNFINNGRGFVRGVHYLLFYLS
jgi:hypothetical protein